MDFLVPTTLAPWPKAWESTTCISSEPCSTRQILLKLKCFAKRRIHLQFISPRVISSSTRSILPPVEHLDFAQFSAWEFAAPSLQRAVNNLLIVNRV
ncbi:hypothetical protein GQ600_27819 [Phytophthora cactorum]|nr:hypothetical protein GQ600_27819 [Phytophthora cactorum]